MIASETAYFGFRRFRLRLSCDWGCTMMGRRSLLLSGAAITGLVMLPGGFAGYLGRDSCYGRTTCSWIWWSRIRWRSHAASSMSSKAQDLVVLEWTSLSCPHGGPLYQRRYAGPPKMGDRPRRDLALGPFNRSVAY